MKRIRLSILLLLAALVVPIAPARASAALTTLPAAPAAHASAATTAVDYVLDARVLDGGQQIVSLTLDTSRLGRVDARSLSAATFTVRARGTSPVPGFDASNSSAVFDVKRVVTDVRLDRRKVVIELLHGFGVAGASTLGYSTLLGRNLLLDLTYTVTQNRPFQLADGSRVTLSEFRQGRVVDPEVDRFAPGVSASGIKYQLFTPRARRHERRPLIVWLHGNGEGGTPGHVNGISPLLANRGALGPATREAQQIFSGAYVLAPQVPDTWFNLDRYRYAERLKALIDTTARRHRVDTKRIYVMGASAGGFMAVQMATRYPEFFAAAVPTCPALYLTRTGEYTMTAEQVKKLNSTPTWFVHAKNDTSVPFDKTSLWAAGLVDDAILTAYDDVSWDGITYDGHWSWIYTARNDPENSSGQTLWEWMARQKR